MAKAVTAVTQWLHVIPSVSEGPVRAGRAAHACRDTLPGSLATLGMTEAPRDCVTA